MIQIKKTILTLVALLAVTTGAWADETLLTTITATAKEQASYSTANVATVSFSYTAGGSSAYLANWGWWGYGWIATVTAAEGYTITKCKFSALFCTFTGSCKGFPQIIFYLIKKKEFNVCTGIFLNTVNSCR